MLSPPVIIPPSRASSCRPENHRHSQGGWGHTLGVSPPPLPSVSTAPSGAEKPLQILQNRYHIVNNNMMPPSDVVIPPPQGVMPPLQCEMPPPTTVSIRLEGMMPPSKKCCASRVIMTPPECILQPSKVIVSPSKLETVLLNYVSAIQYFFPPSRTIVSL